MQLDYYMIPKNQYTITIRFDRHDTTEHTIHDAAVNPAEKMVRVVIRRLSICGGVA